ncbi:gp02 [Escherichia phage Tls]|uniref:Uncharacterized protein n=1 Tax=Escherichia phage Tls TaxID=2892339 RepID=A5PIV9_9CAUD|nr:gp02 [Escherichia phage Tls]AAR09232.1 hypothetical protein GJGTLS_02 [Escherichia phage Tls]
MKYETKEKIAKVIVDEFGRVELTQEQWEEIKEAHRHMISPRVIVRSGGSEFKYVADSPALKTAVNVLLNSGEEFEVVKERVD